MPTLWAHQHYFNNSSTVVPPSLAASDGGYPRWQASVIAVGVFPGQLQLLWEHLIAWIRARFASPSPPPPAPQIITQYVDRIIEKPIDRIIEKPVDRVVLSALETRIRALSAEQQHVLVQTVEVLESPAYLAAQEAVRKTAQTLGFANPSAWQGLSRAMKSSPGRAENTFRHLNAWTLTNEALRAQGSTMTNPQLHFVTELAYQGFALTGR
jgi:hypothetical protein